jgi:hypothetical protein
MAGESLSHLQWVRGQRCVCCGASPCDAHHPTTLRNTGEDACRAHDHFAIPVCGQHHRERHDLNGHFAGWNKLQIKCWETDQAMRTLAKRLAELERAGEGGVFAW